MKNTLKFALIILACAIAIYLVTNCCDNPIVAEIIAPKPKQEIRNDPRIIMPEPPKIVPANSPPIVFINKSPEIKIVPEVKPIVKPIVQPTVKSIIKQETQPEVHPIRMKQEPIPVMRQEMKQEISQYVAKVNQPEEPDLFSPNPHNDFKIPKTSFEDKYWNINNNEYGLLEDRQLYNGKFFNGYTNKSIKQEMKTPQEMKHPMNEYDFPPKILRYEGFDWNRIGVASNKYYNIYFIIYEKETFVDEGIEYNNKLYEYLLVKIVDKKLQIMQIMQPRGKITMGEYVSFTFGVSQLNFLLVSPYVDL